MKTISTLFTAALFVGVSLASFSSTAQTASCTDAELARLEAAAGKMTDATKKATVMKHLSAARDQMNGQKLENCMISIRDAQLAMGS